MFSPFPIKFNTFSSEAIGFCNPYNSIPACIRPYNSIPACIKLPPPNLLVAELIILVLVHCPFIHLLIRAMWMKVLLYGLI